jgi:hypothetical protein
MAPALVDIVLLGIGAAMAPLPVVLAIALLDTRRPVVNSIVYLLGGLLVYVTLALLGGLVVIVVASGLGSRHQISDTAYAIVALIGAIFLFIAVVTWRSKHRIAIPARVNQMLWSLGPYQAFVLGLLLCSPGLKNITLMVAALGTIAVHGLEGLQAAVAMCVFFLIALAPPAAPLVTYLVLPRERAEAYTAQWQAWIDEHARAVIVAVSGLIGIVLLEAGLSGFLS